MSTFALDVGASQGDLVGAINYAIANLGTGIGTSGNVTANIGANVLYVDTTTGQISSNASGTIGYLYGYVNVKYANSATGSSGFTSNCIATQYYGVHNTTNGTISSNPVDYNWYQVTGGFGSTKGLYYSNLGGYQIKFNAGTVPPNQNYAPVKDNTAIALITLANSIVTSNSIQPGAVTNVSIASNTITGNNIQGGTITGNLIAANTIVGNNIQAGTITGTNIQAGTITANLLAANTIFVGTSLQSVNATFDSITSPGFWLDANTGNVRFGGNTSIGNNLTVGANAIIGGNLTVGNNVVIGGNASVSGLITAGALNANVVTTNQLVVNAATQTITVADNTQYPVIQWTIGTTNNPGSAGYIWPYYTRGFAIQGGATLLTTTNGSVTGSKITVNYNAYINTVANATVQSYNLVELWKSGSSAFYKNTFRQISYLVQNNPGGSLNSDYFSVAGDNGSLFLGNTGNIRQIVTGTIANYNTSVGQTAYPDNIGGLPQIFAYGDNGQYYRYNNGGVYQGAGNLTSVGARVNFNVGGSQQYYVYGSSYEPTLLVGSSGTIISGKYLNSVAPTTPLSYITNESSGVFANLNDLEVNRSGNSISAGTNVYYVAVGTSGTILYNARTYDSVGNVATTSGWSTATSGTINNLSAVRSNWSYGSPASTWVAVGEQGTILYTSSSTGSGPWLVANSVPTTVNLQGIGYVNGNWVVVGDAGTIITSTDGSNWTGPIANPADGVTVPANGVRNLYDVEGGPYSNKFVAVGQEIILTSNVANNPTTGGWNSTNYLSGSSVNSSLTRLQYQGSWANVANVSQPPTQAQITNAQIVSGTYTDINYVLGDTITYYLVLGNMFGNAQIYTNGPNMTVTEYKR